LDSPVTTPILTTKLYIPPLPSNLVPRPRLIEKLTQGLNKKLTLVSAPAGFGKTTLLSECVNNCRFPVAWYSLDERDDNLERFLAYLIAALQTIHQDIGVGISKLLGSSQPTPIEHLLTELINQISKTSIQSILVLDDYHIIESLEIDRAIAFFISNMPPQMHMVITTRTDPILPLSRLRSRGQLTEIRIDDLRFSNEEVANFLEKGMGLKVSDKDVATLESRTEGWITGLQLAAISLQRLKHQDDVARFVENFSSSHRYILDYLTDEVLHQRPDGTRDFLLQTSILSSLSAPLCQAVTGMDNSQQILETLDAANLFLIPLDNERCWYRYHHLFADLLQKRLGLYEKEFLSGLHHRAARWYRQNGRISEALNHYLAANDFSGAADLVERNARSLLERSELVTFKSWVDALPETQVKNRPWLCIYHAWALRLSGAPFSDVQARIEDADTAIKNLGKLQKNQASINESTRFIDQADKLNGHILGLKSFQQLYQENIPGVLGLTEQVQAYQLDESFVLASISFARGWALRFSGNLDEAYQAFEDTVQYSLDSGNIYLAVAGLCRSAYGRILGGELQRAYDDYQKAISLATAKDGTEYPVAGYAYIYLGRICYEWNDLETAKQYLLKGIELCGPVGLVMDQVVGLVTLAQLDRANGNLDGMRENVLKAEILSQKMKNYIYVRRWVEDIQVRLWHTLGKRDEIIRWINTCGMTISDGLEYNRDLEHIILARALVYAGINQSTGVYIQDALILLDKLLKKANTAHWEGKVIEILVLKAIAFWVLSDYQSAQTYLMKALIQAESERYIRTFVDEGEPLSKMIAQVREWQAQNPGSGKQPSASYLDRVLVEFDQEKTVGMGKGSAEDKTNKCQPTIDLLSKRELEVLHLLAGGATNQEIAGELVIAVTTAKKHVSNIISKFGVSNRTQAVSRARELNLI
jgi:LuxR family maltose regulon positive regulatory protein